MLGPVLGWVPLVSEGCVSLLELELPVLPLELLPLELLLLELLLLELLSSTLPLPFGWVISGVRHLRWAHRFH